MTMGRIDHHPVLGPLAEREKINILFDGQKYEAYEGESVAAALLANGVRTLRVQEESGAPRGFYCNIGHCFECRVTIDGAEGQRACLTTVWNGMKIESGKRFSTPFKEGEELA